MLFKVQRLLRPGDTHVVGDPFGGLIKTVPEAKRQQLLGSLHSDELAAYGVGAETMGAVCAALEVAVDCEM